MFKWSEEIHVKLSIQNDAMIWKKQKLNENLWQLKILI
jgi:hypothetical protein